MSWSSDGLPVTDASPGLWPLAFAAQHLGPPDLDPAQLRAVLPLVGIRPAGKMRVSGSDLGHSAGRRHVPLYRSADLIRLYEALGRVAEAVTAPEFS
jgi:hypothetical protein